MSRPKFEDIRSGEEFNNWYWLKEELIEICKYCSLSYAGRKFDLRDRIMYALDNDGATLPKPKKHKSKSKFNWAKSELSLETQITDNVSFGPNFRKFMRAQIGDDFSCTSEFMEWVKQNTGKTLSHAIVHYYQLEKRKSNSNFQRQIADSNMFNQYARDFMKDNPSLGLIEVRKFWALKKQLPTDDGFVRYEKSDIELK